MTKKLYKILINGKSCHGGNETWSLPKKVGRKWIAGNWHTVSGNLKVCKKGFHLTTKRFKWYKWGCTAYEAEVKDIQEWQEDKCVARSARLLKPIPHPKWWTDCISWIETLKSISWMKPDGKPKKEWKLFSTRDAARAAAWDAARDAVWDAARAAAWDAAWDAAGDAARDAARAAAGVAAWVAARDAAGAAAGDAAGAAAWAAALFSRTEYICSGIKLESKHRVHAQKRIEVLQKGYGLLCDVNGVLYCYKKI